MSSFAARRLPLAMDVQVSEDEIIVSLADGRRLSAPLVWFPRLLGASATARSNWRLIGDGEGVHWPDTDEDISDPPVPLVATGSFARGTRKHGNLHAVDE